MFICLLALLFRVETSVVGVGIYGYVVFILFFPHFLNSQIWLNQLMDEPPPPQLHHKIENKKTLSNKHTKKKLSWRRET